MIFKELDIQTIGYLNKVILKQEHIIAIKYHKNWIFLYLLSLNIYNRVDKKRNFQKNKKVIIGYYKYFLV